MLEMEKLQNFINGNWVDGERYADVVNPATGEVIVQVPLSDSSVVDEAVQSRQERPKRVGTCSGSPACRNIVSCRKSVKRTQRLFSAIVDDGKW